MQWPSGGQVLATRAQRCTALEIDPAKAAEARTRFPGLDFQAADIFDPDQAISECFWAVSM